MSQHAGVMLLRVKRRFEDDPAPTLWHPSPEAGRAIVFSHVTRGAADETGDMPDEKRPRLVGDVVYDVSIADTRFVDSGYVYDYYSSHTASAPPEGAAECDIAPEALPLFVDGEGPTDSDPGSDSNVEDHYANDYPDESDGSGYSKASDEYDPDTEELSENSW